MSDLISKNEAVKIAKGFTFTFAEERQRYMDFLEYCLNNAPTVDAKPVVHGEWEEKIMNYFCSQCKTAFYDDFAWITGEYKLPNFCPECGADMRKRGE